MTDIRNTAILVQINVTHETARHLLGNYPSVILCFSTIITPTREIVLRDKSLPVLLCHFILQLPVLNGSSDEGQHSEFGLCKYNNIMYT